MKDTERIIKLFMRSEAGEEMTDVVDRTWGETITWLKTLGSHRDFIDCFDFMNGVYDKLIRFRIYRVEFIE